MKHHVVTSGSTATLAENHFKFDYFLYITATDKMLVIIYHFQFQETTLALIDVDADDGEVRLKNSADYENKSSYF